MDWVFCLDQRSANWFADMIKVAVVSAREHTRLRPLCLFDGDQTPPVLTWLERNGVRIIRTQVPFRAELYSERVLLANQGTPYSPEQASGAYLRLMSPEHVESEFFLYSDCDIQFLGDPAPLFVEPTIVGACAEMHLVDGKLVTASAFNSGVMYIKRTAFAAERAAIIERARANTFYYRKTRSFDQTILNICLEGRWTPQDERLNWRAFQGVHPDARILHFHGPKPSRIRALLEGKADESEMQHLWPLVEPQQAAFRHYLDLFTATLARAN